MRSRTWTTVSYFMSIAAMSVMLLSSPAALACIGVNGQVPEWGGSGPNQVMVAKILAVRAAIESGVKMPIDLPVTGTHPAVIILIQNSAASVTFDYGVANWSARITAIANYYTEVSNGLFTISAATESHGTANDGVIGPVDVSGLNSSSDITGSNSVSLAVAAIKAANAYIDFSSYDTDANGTIEPDELHIMFYQAGDETSWYSSTTPRVWAHNYWQTPQLTGLTPSSDSDGVKLVSYNICGEHLGGGPSGQGIATMGQMTHELGHDIGLPDLYDTNGTAGGDWDGLGDHCLMSGGSWGTSGGTAGDKPCHLDGYFKDWLGWANFIQATDGSQSVTLNAANGSNDVFRVDIPGTNEFFIIENRQQTGYDAGLPNTAGGLAIYHCDWTLLDPASSYWNQNEVNAYKTGNTPGPGMKLEEAHGVVIDLDLTYPPDTDRGWDDDYFRSGNNTDFDDTSDPDSDEKNGTSSGVDASSVPASGSSMTFTLVAPTGQGTEGESEGEEDETGIRFSVDALAIGVAGSKVNQNRTSNPTEVMGDIYAGWSGTNTLSISRTQLGLQPGDDVDAIHIPDPNVPNMETHHLDAYWHFGVDLNTVGNAGASQDVASEALSGEAAGDIFWSQGIAFGWPVAGGNTLEVEEGWIGLLDGTVPPEDNKDALDIYGPLFSIEEPLPLGAVYFSLRTGSPSVGAGVSPADILQSNGLGGFTMWRSASSLGLMAVGDDLDALFIDSTFVPYFSLAPGSATLPLIPGPPQGSPADIFYPGAPFPTRAVTAQELGLKLDDNVDALDITMDLIEGTEGEDEFEFTRLPVGGWFEVGQRLTMTVEVTGTVGAVTYQWLKDDSDTGVTSNVYDVLSVSEADEGWYVCRVTDQGKTVKSTPATHVEVFASLPAVGLAALIAGAAVVSGIGAWRLRRRQK